VLGFVGLAARRWPRSSSSSRIAHPIMPLPNPARARLASSGFVRGF
jgi:hypothetical protein